MCIARIELVLTNSPELGSIDPYLIDLISCADLNGNLYDHLELDPASTTVVNSSVVNYALGGSDGTISFSVLQTLMQNWLNGSSFGEFTNLQQHPMTHFYDVGFTTITKNLLFNMLDLRDNFKIDMSTQDVSQAPNTEAQDLAAGQALAFRAQMHPNNVINGVGCSRVSVFAQCGKLISGSAYDGYIPFNLNRLIQRRDLDGGTYIKGSSGGRPNSEVTIFRQPNWVADSDAVRKLAWADAINTAMHATRTVLFYPSLRTVYPNDTSLFSDDEIADRICYSYKICREVWSIYAGVRQPSKKLWPLIQNDLNNKLAAAFANDSLNFQATLFQTAGDANLGYATSVNLAVSGVMPQRVFNTNVILSRQSA